MSAALYREGPDLDELLAELDAEHGGQVHVLEIDYTRDGGVMGFFAHRRVGVHYCVGDPAALVGDRSSHPPVAPAPQQPFAAAGMAPQQAYAAAGLASQQAYAAAGLASQQPYAASQPSARPAAFEPASDAASPLEDLLRAAEAAEMVESGRAPSAAAAPAVGEQDNLEFARMLLEMAGQKAAERAGAEPAAQPQFVPSAQAHVEPAPAAETPTFPMYAPAPDVAVAAAPYEPRGRVRRPAGAHRAPEDVPAVDVDVAALPPATRVPRPSPAPSPAPVPTPGVAAAIPAPQAPAASPRTNYTLRRQLAELGVPIDRIPDHDNAYLVIEQLVRQAPPAEDIDPVPGQLIVVAGPARHVLAEATRLCTRLRLDPAELRTAGFGADPLTHRREAVSLAHRVRADGTGICVVAVATDSTVAEADAGGRDDLAWAAALVSALSPDHLLVVVEATSKPADVRSMLGALGPATALAVVGAARTASPASLWELGLGVVSLDGRPATPGAWAALLIDRLADLDLV